MNPLSRIGKQWSAPRSLRTSLESALRQALDLDVEIEIEIETTDTEESRAFKRILTEEGVKPAIAWREARFAVEPVWKTGDVMAFQAFVVRKEDDRRASTRNAR